MPIGTRIPDCSGGRCAIETIHLHVRVLRIRPDISYDEILPVPANQTDAALGSAKRDIPRSGLVSGVAISQGPPPPASLAAHCSEAVRVSLIGERVDDDAAIFFLASTTPLGPVLYVMEFKRQY